MTETVRTHRHGWWWKTLLGGTVLWIVAAVVTAATENANLVPTVILLGSFLVPLVVVLFVAERIHGVGASQLLLGFFVAGVLGVLGASLLEANLASSIATVLLVGVIEEAVKGVLLVLAAVRLPERTAAQGALLGAVVGAGFAAFESAGYAFNAALTQSGISLARLVETEALRAVLTPVGHVLWTAILAAAIVGGGTGALRRSLRVGLVFVAVALLHALWDAAGGIAAALALLATGNLAAYERFGRLPDTAATAVQSLELVLYVVLLLLVALLGVTLLWLLLRRLRRREAAVG